MNTDNINTTNESGAENTTATENTNTNDTQKTTFTIEEVQKMIQSETDKRVTQALKTAELKNNKKIKEAEKLATMSATEKYEYELQQREQAIADKERELTLAENKAAAASILADKGISATLVDLVVTDDADTMHENIDKLDKAFKASVKAEVEKRLASNSPKSSISNDTITKESFSKMSLKDAQNLYKTNPELYKKLSGN